MSVHCIVALALVSLAVAQQVDQSSLQCSQRPVQVVHGKGPLSFGVIGDWGRLGGTRSITPRDQGGFDVNGYCASRFSNQYDEDVRGAVSQLSVAASLEKTAGSTQPQFIVNTGDNFYECGVDTPLRLDMDWNRVYGLAAQPNINNLTWYNIFGNHDVYPNSVQSQLDYAKYEPRWVMPCRHYAVDFVNTLDNGRNVTMRVLFINNTPWVSYYNLNSGTGSYFNTPEVQATSVPTVISDQLDWIDATLNSSTATWNVIVGHQPMVTSSPWGYGPFTDFFNRSGESLDPGMPDANGRPAYNRLYRLINKYNVDVYFNGHDHINAHMIDPIDPVNRTTQYITTGAGSVSDAINGCGYGARSFVQWVGATYNGDITCSTKPKLDMGKLLAISYYYRVYVAALSAIAEQNTEMALLQQAASIGSMSLGEYIDQNLQNVTGVNATTAALMNTQMANATCGCANVPLNSSTSLTWLSSGLLLNAFNNTADGTSNYTLFWDTYCAPWNTTQSDGVKGSLELVPANLTADGTIFGPVAANVSYSPIFVAQPVTDPISFCQRMLASVSDWRDRQTQAVRQLLIDQRLGNMNTTGKVAARNQVYGALRYWVVNSAKDLFDPLFTFAKGTDPVSDIQHAAVDTLQSFFVTGPYYSTQPQPASLSLTRRTVYAPDVVLPDLAQKALARLNETRFEQLDTMSVALPADPVYATYGYPNLTVSQLLTLFSNALGNLSTTSTTCTLQGCTSILLSDNLTTLYLANGTMADPNDPNLGPLRTNYLDTPLLGTAFPGYVMAKVDDKSFQISYYVLPSYTSSLTQQPYNVTITKASAATRRVVRRRRRSLL